jgi:hypothetical protein
MKRFQKVTLFLLTTALITGMASANDARVRVIHASPDAPAVDILVNDDLRAFQNIAFGEASEYAPVPANVYNVKVVPATAGPGSAVIEADLNLFFKTDYTVIAVDFLDEITPIVLQDDREPVSFRESRIRFVHASPNAPPVDIKIQDGPFLFQDVEFKENGGYVTVPEGMYNLEVRVAGTDTVALELPAVMLDRGTTYTVVATGLVNGTPSLDVILAEDTSLFRSNIRFWRNRR